MPNSGRSSPIHRDRSSPIHRDRSSPIHREENPLHFEIESSSRVVGQFETNNDVTDVHHNTHDDMGGTEGAEDQVRRDSTFSARARRGSVISTKATTINQRETFSKKIEQDIHTQIIKWPHFIFFGGGETYLSIIPLMWSASTFAPLILYQLKFYEAKSEQNNPTPRFILAARLTVFAFSVMIVSTYTFGWFYCRAKHFEDCILTSAKDLKDRLYYVKVLAYIYIACLLFSFVPPACLLPKVNLDLMVELGIVKTPGGGVALILFGFYPFFFTNMSQIGLWIWMLYIKYDSFRHKIVPYLVPKYSAFCKEITINFVENLDRHSSLWKYIHVARLLTGLVISLSYVVSIYYAYNSEYIIGGDDHRPVQKSYYISAFIIFYGGLWSIVFGSGVLNDIINFKLRNTLSSLLLDMDDEYEASLGVKDLAISKGGVVTHEGDEMSVKNIMSLDEAKSLVRDLVIAMSVRNIGIKVAGLVVHAEKALALGSIFFAILTGAAQAGLFENHPEAPQRF